MRFVPILALTAAALAVLADTGTAASARGAEAANSCAAKAPGAAPPHGGLPAGSSAAPATRIHQDAFPQETLWPLGLFVGYISMSLKRQVQRRGYPSGDRRRSFSDLVSLRRPPTDAPSGQSAKERTANRSG